MSKYINSGLDRVPDGSKGGSVRLTISSNAAHQTTSTPCKKVWLNSSHVDVRVTFGTACTATTGLEVPQADQANDVWAVLELDVDDITNLYFYGATDTATIDILYRV